MNNRQSKLQLKRLNTVTDVVYGIIVWRFFDIIPKPVQSSFNVQDLKVYLSANYTTLIIGLIGVLVAAIYWMQNNRLSAQLTGSDGKHSSLRFVQLFFLLLFLYSLKFGIDNGATPLSRAFESAAAALMGIFAVLAFLYASKNHRLIRNDVMKPETWELSITIIAEPLTATFTLLFVSYPWLWEISWLSYPFFKFLMNRLSRKLRDPGTQEI